MIPTSKERKQRDKEQTAYFDVWESSYIANLAQAARLESIHGRGMKNSIKETLPSSSTYDQVNYGPPPPMR
jgi:hypothetical protein